MTGGEEDTALRLQSGSPAHSVLSDLELPIDAGELGSWIRLFSGTGALAVDQTPNLFGEASDDEIGQADGTENRLLVHPDQFPHLAEERHPCVLVR